MSAGSGRTRARSVLIGRPHGNATHAPKSRESALAAGSREAYHPTSLDTYPRTSRPHMPPLPQTTPGCLIPPTAEPQARSRHAWRPWATVIGLLLPAIVLTNGCEIHDEQVQAHSVRVSEQRLLPSPDGVNGQMVNHAAPTSIEYVEDYQAGLERATATGKPLVIICRASWCRWCAGLSQGVLADPEVVQRSSRCVCVTLDADRDAEICRKLGVRGFPTVILQTPTGREVKRLTGRSEVRTLAAAIDEATARIAAAPKRSVSEGSSGRVLR